MPSNLNRCSTLLADRLPADLDETPDTGLPPEWERALSAPFVVHERYGTRCSTVLLVEHDGRTTMLRAPVRRSREHDRRDAPRIRERRRTRMMSIDAHRPASADSRRARARLLLACALAWSATGACGRAEGTHRDQDRWRAGRHGGQRPLVPDTHPLRDARRPDRPAGATTRRPCRGRSRRRAASLRVSTRRQSAAARVATTPGGSSA